MGLSYPAMPATSSDKARGIPDRVVYYQFRHDRPAEHCAASTNKSPKPNGPQVTPQSSATGSSNSPARLRPSTASWRPKTVPWPVLRDTPPTSPRRRLVPHPRLPPAVRIDKSFRMSKHDLQARPIYHHIRESIRRT